MWEALRDFYAELDWVAWFGLAIAVGIADLVLGLDLVLVMLALGAAGGGVAAVLDAPFWACLLVAIAISSATLLLVRPRMVARMHRGVDLRTGHDALQGATAVVVEEVGEMSGRVKLSGELWSARAYDPHEVIAPGTKVRVFSIEGATAVVHPD